MLRKKLLLLVLLIVGCSSKNDAVISNKIDQECRVIGNVDGKDNIVTGLCCPDDCSTDISCGCDGSIDGVEPNPNFDETLSPSCNGQPIGDAAILPTILVDGSFGDCGSGNPVDPLSPENCDIFYWADINGDGLLSLIDVSILWGYVNDVSETQITSFYCIPDTSNSPCAGKCIEEECCVPK